MPPQYTLEQIDAELERRARSQLGGAVPANGLAPVDAAPGGSPRGAGLLVPSGVASPDPSNPRAGLFAAHSPGIVPSMGTSSPVAGMVAPQGLAPSHAKPIMPATEAAPPENPRTGLWGFLAGGQNDVDASGQPKLTLARLGGASVEGLKSGVKQLPAALEAQNARTAWEAEHPEEADIHQYRNTFFSSTDNVRRYGELMQAGMSEEDALRKLIGEGAKAGTQGAQEIGQALDKAMPEDERYAHGKSSGMIEGAVRGMTEFAPSLAASAVNPVLGLTTTAGQLAGGHYKQLKEEGVEPARAAQAAFGSAAVESPLFAATNLLNVNVLGKVFGKNPLAMKFGQAATGANSAGAAAALATIPQEIATTWGKNPDMTLKEAVEATGGDLHDTMDESGNVRPGLLSKMGEAYISNAVGTGVLHGAGMAAGKVVDVAKGMSPAERAAALQKLYVADLLNTPGEVEKFVRSASPAEVQQVHGIAQDLAKGMGDDLVPGTLERHLMARDVAMGKSVTEALPGQDQTKLTPFTEGLLKLDQEAKRLAQEQPGVPFGPDQPTEAQSPQLTRQGLAKLATGDLEAKDALYGLADAYDIPEPHKMEPADLVDGIMAAQEARGSEVARHTAATQAVTDMQSQAEQARNDILTATDEAGRLDAIKRFEDATRAMAQTPALPAGQGFGIVGEPEPVANTAARREQMAREVMQPQPEGEIPGPEPQTERGMFDRENEDAFGGSIPYATEPKPSAPPMEAGPRGQLEQRAQSLDSAITEAAQTGDAPDAQIAAEREAIGKRLSEDDAARAVARQEDREPEPGALADAQQWGQGDGQDGNQPSPENLPERALTPEAFAERYGIPVTPTFLDAIKMYQEITGTHQGEPAPREGARIEASPFEPATTPPAVPLPAGSVDVPTVEKWLAPVRERLASHVNLKVVGSPEEIPAAERARLTQADPNWMRNAGAATKDGSYLFSWNLGGSPEEVRALTTHEVKHQAILQTFERMFEEQPHKGLPEAQMQKTLSPLIEARRGEIETLMRQQFGEGFDPNNKVHMLVGASEWLANAKNVEPKLYEKFTAAIRSALRSTGEKLDIYWLKDMKMSDAEIKDFNARVMRDALRPGVPVDEMASYSGVGRKMPGEAVPVAPESAGFRRGTGAMPTDIADADHNIAFDAKPRFTWDKEGVKKWLYDKFVNADQPWVRYAEMAGSDEGKAMDERTSRLRGLGGITNEALAGDGLPAFWKSGRETEKSGVGPLSSVLEQIKSQDEYKNYEILRKGERMLALAKYRPEFTPERAAEMRQAVADIKDAYGTSPTPKEIREMKQLIADTQEYYRNGVKGVDAALWKRNLDTLWAQIGPEEYSRLQKVSAEHRQWERNAILKPLVESGVMSREKYDAIRNAPENEYYASFQREMNSVERQVLGTREVVKRLKGSELATVPSTESTIANFTRTVRLIETNARNKQFVDLRHMSDDLAEVIKPMKVNPEHPPADALVVYEGGKKHYYSAPGDIVKAAQSMTPQETNLAMKLLQWPAKALRAGSTLTAEFMARNPIRDQTTAYLFSKYGYVPYVDAVKGLMHVLGKTDLYREYRASGAEQAYFTALDRQFAGKTANELMGLGDKGVVKYLKNPIEGLRWLNEWSEKSTRVGAYAKAKDMGATPMQAMHEARDISIDFGRMGSQGKIINSIAAFWNANVQDIDKMRRSFKERPGTTATRMLLGVTLPSLALWMINKDEQWYKELPEWRKNAFWNFKAGDGPILSLPKPFLPGLLFGSLPERILDFAYLNDKQSIPAIISNVGEQLRQVALPLPTSVVPAIENWANYSFFRGGPLENAGAQRLPPGLRANTGTSKFLSEVGKMTDISPIKMENAIRGVFGGLGSYGLTALDAGTKIVTGNDVPEVGKHWYEWAPGVRGFVTREPIGSSSKSVEEFYDNYESASQAKAGFEALKRSGNQSEAKKYADSHSHEIAMSRVMGHASDALSKIRQGIAAIQRDQYLNSDEKRKRIDALSQSQTDIAVRANAAFYSKTRGTP